MWEAFRPYYAISVDVVLVVAMTIALVGDIRHKRIYWWMTWPTAVVGVVLAVLAGGWGDSWLTPGLKSSTLGFASLWIVFRLSEIPGWVGGGDTDVLGALGALLGFPAILGAFLFISIAGGVQAVVVLLARTSSGRRIAARLGARGTDSPEFGSKVRFGISIAVGALAFRLWIRN